MKSYTIDRILGGRNGSITNSNPMLNNNLQNKGNKNLFISKQKISTDRLIPNIIVNNGV